MRQLRRETAEDTLRKLESFDWSKSTKVIIIIEGDEACEIVTDNNNSSVNRPSTSFSQDTRGTHQEPNKQTSNRQSHTGQANNVSPSSQYNCEFQNHCFFVSKQLIIIATKHSSLTPPDYEQFKKNIFTLLKHTVLNYIVPYYKDHNFLATFLQNTFKIGLFYECNITRLYLELLFYEMIIFATQETAGDETGKGSEDILTSKKGTTNETNYIISKIGTLKNTNHLETSEKTQKNKQKHSQHVKSLTNSYIDGKIMSNDQFGRDPYNNEQRTVIRELPPPYREGLSEVAMSPVSLDGENDTRHHFMTKEVPTLNPIISFVTSTNPQRTVVPDGRCRICNTVTNRICLGCSKYIRITYYCSQTCQDNEWPSHMYECNKPL